MEAIKTYVGENNLHLILKIIGLLSLPWLTIVYLIFSPITIPLSLVIWHFYNKEIKTHLKGQYQSANEFVQQLEICKNVSGYSASLFELISNLKNWAFEKGTSALQQITDLLLAAKEVCLQYSITKAIFEKIELIHAFINGFKNFIFAVGEQAINILAENQVTKFCISKYETLVVPAWQFVMSKTGVDFLCKFAYEKIVQIPNTKQHIIGYAILNESGKIVQNLKEEQEIDRFVIQKHQYAATQFWKVKTLQDLSILELECGDGVGLQYLAETYNPKTCVGVDSSDQQIQTNIKQFSGQENLKFETRPPLEIGALCSPNTFDIIMALELKKKLAFQNIDLQSYIRVSSTLLKEDGYFIIGEYGTQAQMQQFQQDIQQNGLIINEKCDLTVGVSQAMKLQVKYIVQQIQQNGNFVAKLLSRWLKPNQKLLKEFRDREQIYMVYILKKGSI